MKIPITKNLSTEVTDLVGTLDVPQDMADYMAECYWNDLRFEMNACIVRNGDKYTLKHVSLSEVAKEPQKKNMQLLDQYFELKKQIHEHFGYVENWVVIPLNDSRDYFWWCDGQTVGFAKTVEELESQDGNYCENEVYTQRHLPKWVYEADDFTMICVDTRTDGNKFLQVFDNAKRREKVAA